MTPNEQKKAAAAFVEKWKDRGDEKQETALFWIELLGNVLGVENPTSYIEFEKPVIVEKNQKYIDGYIPSVKILIEQKGSHIKLGKTAVQSDGEKLTPYNNADKRLFDNGAEKKVKNINAYLMGADNLFIESRRIAISSVPEITKGFQATDNGFLILSEDEKNESLCKGPEAKKWIRPYSMGFEFINNVPRYCLWLVGIEPNELNKLPYIKKRVANCREYRCNAPKTGDAYKLKDIPHLFRPCKQFKDVPYIAIPLVSSEQKRYMPMGFIYNRMIPGNNLFCIFNAGLYHFGILTSNVHMAWMRAVGGRLKSDPRYSKDLVYNNFPWCNPTPEQKAKIEKTAQMILDARSEHPDCSLADLYDETVMPADLRKAHQANDRAVMEAYGFWGKLNSESECVAELMKMYQKLVEQENSKERK